MKIISILILVCKIILFVGCNDKSVNATDDSAPNLHLSCDKSSGNAPLKVNFTGSFQGKIDTLKMLIPECILLPDTNLIVSYILVKDSTASAKKIYTAEFIYQAGTFKAVMFLRSKYKEYYSDTVTINVK
jgi:hypothetical protein